MGNGAGSDGKSFSYHVEDTTRLEKLVSGGYYTSNFHEFKSAVTEAIRKDSLASLEVLIKLSSIKKIKPLHLAGRLGKLEATEIFLSAGFSCFDKDNKGRTPLHVCCLNASVESALVASLLTLYGKKALKMLDEDGLSPLHLATKENNVIVIEALIDGGIDLKIKDKNGLTAIDIAKRNGFDETLKLLKNPEKRGNSKLLTASRVPPIVDEKRIMLIWEAFFENAFKRLELDINDDFSDFSAKKITKKNPKNDDYYNGKDGFYENKEEKELDIKPSNNKNKEQWISDEDFQTEILSWFDWIAIYEDNQENQENEGDYYVVNKYSGESKWLTEHLDAFKSNSLLPCDNWENYEELVTAPYPINLYDTIVNGWITFYEKNENICRWFNFPTHCFEDCLPLGYNENKELLNYLNLHPYIENTNHEEEEEDTTAENDNWFFADQAIAISWVLVFCDTKEQGIDSTPSESSGSEGIISEEKDKNDNNHDPRDDFSNIIVEESKLGLQISIEQSNDQGWNEENNFIHYYLNFITGETSWEEPMHWEEVKATWGSTWSLCCYESNANELFWFDFETGESAWAEPG